MTGMIILGSAFAVANPRQDNTHLLVTSKNRNVLIDCGNNPVGKIEQKGVKIEEITDLVLTHAHADHMGALPLLIMDMWLRKRQTPLKIYGLEYTLERAKMLLDVFNWQNWGELYQVEFIRVDGDQVTLLFQDEGIKVSAVEVAHSVPTMGVRIDFEESKNSVVYSSDTAPCESLDNLAKGADILIQESAGFAKIHTSPEQAGETAARAGVKKLIMIHYDAARDPKELLAEAGRGFAGSIELATDLMRVV